MVSSHSQRLLSVSRGDAHASVSKSKKLFNLLEAFLYRHAQLLLYRHAQLLLDIGYALISIRIYICAAAHHACACISTLACAYIGKDAGMQCKCTTYIGLRAKIPRTTYSVRITGLRTATYVLRQLHVYGTPPYIPYVETLVYVSLGAL